MMCAANVDDEIAFARRELKRWHEKVKKLELQSCASSGHIRGARAWPGVWQCERCGRNLFGCDFTQSTKAK